MKISIVIPNFNKGKYLKQCLESCLNQTYENTQIIFIDNESKDNSLQLAKEIRENLKKDFIIDVAENIYPRCWDECIDKIKEYIKDYKDNNKDKMQEYSKEYYEKNKDKINTHYICDVCNGRYTHNNRIKHINTEKHQTELNNLLFLINFY